jgi:hypothetical protein
MADVGAIPDDPQTRIRGATQPAGIDWDRLSRAVGGPSRDALAADDAKIASLEPRAPVLTPMPPKEQPSDPLQAFGQPALWIAAIGGLLARNHLTSAIQSASAVMQSTHQQDQAITQRHYDEWKINTENALKMAKYEQDAYKAALAKKTTDVREAEAEFRTVALAAKNAGAIKALDEGGLDGAARYAEAHRRGVQRIEEGASNFSAHVDAQTKIAEGLGSDDPTQQAEALDLYAAQIDQAQKGKGSTATSRMGTLTVGVRLRSIADALRSGDPEKMAAAQREAAAMPELGPGVLKPPRAPDVGSPKADRAAIAAGVIRDHPEWTDDQKAVETERLFKQAEAAPRPQTTPWTILTEPSTNQQYRARTGPDGKPEYTDMAGNQIEPPKGAERISTQQHGPAPGSLNADRAALEDGIQRAHPDWPIDQVVQEAQHQQEQNRVHEAHEKAIVTGQAKQSLAPKKAMLNPEAVDMEAKQFLVTGQMPSMGFGGSDARIQILNRAAELASEQGHTIEDYIAGRAAWKADTASLGQITKIADAVNGFENTALHNMEVAEKLMDKGAGTSLGPVVNRWLQGGKQATGDPDVAAFNTAMGTVSSEYGKIISGGSASIASTPEGAREEAAEWLNKIQSPEAINAQFAVARQDMTNRKNSLFQQKEAIQQRLRSPELGAPPPSQSDVPVITDKTAYDALPAGSHYRKASDPPDSYRTKR